MTHFSLFSGTGGIDLAAEWAGFETVGQCEIDPYCRRILERHWPDVPRWEDIWELTGDEIRERCGPVVLVSGGFPCQSVSQAGKQGGTGDDRWLWPQMLRIVREVAPRWVLAENVRGLLSIKHGLVFESVLSDLEAAGYETVTLEVPAAGVGAPHLRYRIFIVAHAEMCRCERGRQDKMGERGEMADGSTGSGEDVAHAEERAKRARLCESGPGGQRRRRPGDGSGSNVSDAQFDTDLKGISWAGYEQAPGQDWWAAEPGVCGMATGISEGLDGGIDDQKMGATGSAASASERRLRRVWNDLANRATSPGRGQDEQLAGELADAMPKLSYAMALGSRESASSAALAFLLRMRQAFAETGALRDSSKSISQAWQSLSGQEKERAFLAACGRADWSIGEWAGVGRVATGVPARVDRLRALGNAVVPHQVYPIVQAIAEVERNDSEPE